MKRRTRPSRPGRWPLVGLALIFAVLALFSGLDRASANRPGLAALVPSPFRSVAAVTTARRDLANEDAAGAVRASTQAIRSAPIDYSAPALLGTARLLKDDFARGDAAFRAAAAFGWRDPLTQLYWTDVSLNVGEPELAAMRADALLRANPARRNAQEVLRRFEEDPSARRALAERLALRPDWLQRFLSPEDLGAQPLSGRAAILTDPAMGDVPLGCARVARLAVAMADRVDADTAEAVRMRHCPGAQSLYALRDASFAGLDDWKDPDPLGWKAAESGSVTVRRELRDGHPVIVLNNDAPGARALLEQPEWLAAGTVEAQWRVIEGAGDRFAVSLDCGQPRRPRFAPSQRQRMDVPACQRQRLSLWLAPGSGPVVIGDFALSRVAAQR